MAYIDRDYFDGYSPGNTLSDLDFSYLAQRASEIIDGMTMGKIERFGFARFSDFTKERIKKAAAAQVELLFSQGGKEALMGGADALIQSLSVGDFSYTSSNTGGVLVINGIPVSPIALFYLQSTGLLYSAMDKNCDGDGYQ